MAGWMVLVLHQMVIAMPVHLLCTSFIMFIMLK